MNTIPTTFNQAGHSYTAVGGLQRSASTGMSAVILNRGGRYLRRSVFQEYEKAGFDFVISVESNRENYDVEELSLRFPFVKFLLTQGRLSPGEQINLAAGELKTPLFFVLWNDARMVSSSSSARVAERLFADAGGEVAPVRLCTVPLVQNARFETLPTLIAPAFFHGTVKTVPFASSKEGLPSLYPFDGIGIYDRERFVRLGGFDATIKSPYWQLMDFGFRAHLWGEEIRNSQLVKVVYDGELPPEDASAAAGHTRFYLKNLAPVFRGDSAALPFRRFLSYLLRSGEGPLAAWNAFGEARRWIQTNRFRFRCDARRVTELWESAES